VALCNDKWRGAMDEEYNALLRNQMWHFSPHQASNVIDCKWVYKIKRKQDGSMDRYNARLIAKQRYRIDYSDTFIPVIKG
jgi:hypothetical protein